MLKITMGAKELQVKDLNRDQVYIVREKTNKEHGLLFVIHGRNVSNAIINKENTFIGFSFTHGYSSINLDTKVEILDAELIIRE